MLKINPEAISSFGFNIASGIILEKLIENKAKKLPIFFNARTLFRNYVGCLDGKADDKISALKNSLRIRTILKNFIEDTKLLIHSFLENGYDINFYEIDYKPFLKKVMIDRDQSSIKGLRGAIKYREKNALIEISKNFPGIYIKSKPKLELEKKCYIVTHIGIELLNFIGNEDVLLAESHTGEIKDYTRWYSKYAKIGARRMDIFPFNEFIYNILGDYEYVEPLNIKLRKHIYNIAIEEAWTSSMSEKAVKKSLKRKDLILFRELDSNYHKYFK